MTPTNLTLLILCPVGIAFGQILFKLGASSIPRGQGVKIITSICTNPWVYGAFFLYAVVSLLWVYVLQDVPLVRAYPFMAAAFALVPVLGMILLGESVGPYYLLGVGLIIAGLLLTSIF